MAEKEGLRERCTFNESGTQICEDLNQKGKIYISYYELENSKWKEFVVETNDEIEAKFANLHKEAKQHGSKYKRRLYRIVVFYCS